MRTKKSLINIVVGIGGQLLGTVLSFVGRLIFIHYLSAAYLGINGLFTDILGMLNLAELGIGSAMIFSMYRPAAEDDEKSLTALMNLYRRLYRYVAAFVLVAGLALLPFLPRLIKDSSQIEHLRLIYLLYLGQAVCSYLLSYKNSIYQAYQKAYIRVTWEQIVRVVMLIAQTVVLVLTRNFILYLAIQVFAPVFVNLAVSLRVDRDYPYLKEDKKILPDVEEKKEIIKNIGALSIHKVATVVVKGTDNLIMSTFIGLSTVGIYSNYKLVLTSINSFAERICSALAGSVGNLGATEDADKIYEVYKILDFAMFGMYGYVAGGLIILFNLFIRLCFGESYLFSMSVVLVIVIEFYLSGSRKINLQFREAMGLFWQDRYKAVAEAIINLIASILLVKKFGVVGVVGGTILSTLLTCFWVEPYILMRYGIIEHWKTRLRDYFMDYGKRVLTVCAVVLCGRFVYQCLPDSNFFWFVVDGVLYTCIYAFFICLVFGRSKEFQYLLNRAKNRLNRLQNR